MPGIKLEILEPDSTMNGAHVIVDSVAFREDVHAHPAYMRLAPYTSDVIAALAALDRDLTSGTVLHIMRICPFLE